MIDRVIALSIRHRAWVIAAAVLVALWGWYSVARTPVDVIPDLSENQAIVWADWPGHGPREVEDQVAYPLSLGLQGLASVRVVRSSSDMGFAQIHVIFEDGIGWQSARQHVAEALANVTGLPPGVKPRLGPDADATGQIFWYTVEGDNTDSGRLRAVQDWLIRPQLAAVPGVAEVASVGGQVLEYQVEIDLYRSNAFGVTSEQVAEAVAKANAAVGGDVVHTGNAEFAVRGVGWLGARPGQPDAEPSPRRTMRDLENVPLKAANGAALRLADVARVSIGAAPRRGVLERDGSEVTGGVVLMRHGENPRAVTRRLRQKLVELQDALPPGVRVMPFYDRTPFIDGAIGTVTGSLLEATATAALCIVLVLRHWRTSLVVAVVLPLAVLASFGLMHALRLLGVADVQANVMSLAGLAVAIGILVDSSVVMAENVMHRLRTEASPRPVRGDTRALVLPACLTVGRPIFFSVVVMILSFLPIFALGGLEGKMFHPLAVTKSFALMAAGALAITLVPALCTVLVKGRLRSEEDVWLVRSLTRIYRPVLSFFLNRPVGLVWFVGVALVVGLAPLGHRGVLLAALGTAIVVTAWAARTWGGKLVAVVSLVVAALAAEQRMTPLARAFIAPLDEGMVMDMPITVPRIGVTQAADDLKARDMIFCRFPEVDMVVGKAGRAESAFDPAPLDMIETMVNFRPYEFWPKRVLRSTDVTRQTAAVLDKLIARGLVLAPKDRAATTNEAAMDALTLFETQMREAAYQDNQEFELALGADLAHFTETRLIDLLDGSGALRGRPVLAPHHHANGALAGHVRHLAMGPAPEAVAALAHETLHRLADQGLLDANAEPAGLLDRLTASVKARYRDQWAGHVRRLDADLLKRAPALFTRLALEVLLHCVAIADERVAAAVVDWQRARTSSPATGGQHHHHSGGMARLPELISVPELDSIQEELTRRFAQGLLLWQRDRAELSGPGGELDRAMHMPGWANVWTMPIQNRVDMLATGVNTMVGVRVLGRRLQDVVEASEAVARVLKKLPGASDVIAEPVRGKGYLEAFPDRAKVARLGVAAGTVTDLVEFATGGRVVTTTVEGRERHPVRVRFARSWRTDVEALRRLPVPIRSAAGPAVVPLGELADVRLTEGPAAIKSENGLLRNYVRLNVRGRDAEEFVAAAKQVVAAEVKLPPGVHLEWTGQFEHQARAGRTLLLIVPVVIGLIFLVLWWTFHDLADAALMLLTVPGAIAGGVFVQWLVGHPLSVTAWVGLIACFGMAASTGVVMLVYLREAIAKAGGLAELSPEKLRQAVLDGAAHRLRPKLLTEATTVLGLAPLLWSSGPGSEILRPMAVPVLGGILFADEVIDLFLPVLFYRVRLARLRRLTGRRTTVTEGQA